MPEVRRLLRAAERAGRIKARRAVRMWVTEFSWDSSPPDRYGVPDRLLTRWVAEALDVLWHDGVELVTWFQIRDQVAPPQGLFQSGLYLRCATGLACDRPKPMLAAFRFPFTAYRKSGRVEVWGRTPSGLQRDRDRRAAPRGALGAARNDSGAIATASSAARGWCHVAAATCARAFRRASARARRSPFAVRPIVR